MPKAKKKRVGDNRGIKMSCQKPGSNFFHSYLTAKNYNICVNHLPGYGKLSH